MSGENGTTPVESIRDLLEQGRACEAGALFTRAELEPPEVRALFGSLAGEQGAALVRELDDNAAREVLLWLTETQAAEILAHLDAANAARLVSAVPSDERADLLGAVDEEHRAPIQAALPAGARAEAAQLLQYPPDTAGGLMQTELLAYPAETTVRDAIRDLRANREHYAAIGVQYVYIVDSGRRLVGVAPIRDLMLAPENARLDELLIGPPVAVSDMATTRELADAFDEHPFVGLPVIDKDGVLLGVVSRADATESEHEQAEEQYRVAMGIVGGEEIRSMPLVTRLRRRTGWLGVNMVLGLGGAAVVALNQGTIAKVLVVAAVLPVVSATSGNAAMQSAAVSIRELTLGIIDPASWRRVVTHEMTMGVLLSIPLGLAAAVLTRFFGGEMIVGLAVGVAMALNTLLAVGLGSMMPLLLRRLRIDPALASGPITTTLMDVTGFALVFTCVGLVS